MSRGSQRIGLLKQMSRYLPPSTTANLYLYYVRPCFEYASPVWHCATPASAAQSLERLQASMARTILHAEWTTPKKELLAALQWPSLRMRRAIASLTLFHCLKNSPTPVASSCLPVSFASDNSCSRRRQHGPPTHYPLNPLHSIFFLPLSSSLEHTSKLHSVALIHIFFSTCFRGTLARIQIPYRHRHPSPTCLVRMAPTITDDGSSVSSLSIKSTIQRNIP